MRRDRSNVDSYDSLSSESPDSWIEDLLKAGYSISQPDKCGEYMLGVACSRLQLEQVRLALSHGADLNSRDFQGNTPLLGAIDVSHHDPSSALEIVKLLVGAGADIEIRGYMDKTPFLKACTRGCLDILQFLISVGCDIHAQTAAPDGFTGIDCATTFENSPEFKAYVYSLYDA